jgi:hypothetical protein
VEKLIYETFREAIANCSRCRNAKNFADSTSEVYRQNTLIDLKKIANLRPEETANQEQINSIEALRVIATVAIIKCNNYCNNGTPEVKNYLLG